MKVLLWENLALFIVRVTVLANSLVGGHKPWCSVTLKLLAIPFVGAILVELIYLMQFFGIPYSE